MAETHRKKDRKSRKPSFPKERFRGKESNVREKAERRTDATMAAEKEISDTNEGEYPAPVTNTDPRKGSYISLRRDWLNAG